MILASTIAILMMQAAGGAPAPKAAAPQPVTKEVMQANVKRNFERLDANKDGWVDKAEVERARNTNLAAMQKRRADQVTAVFARLDTNKDGTLSKQEFDAFFRRVQLAPDLAYLTSNDRNKDGRVSQAEATAQAMAVFDQRDTDRNGILTQREAQARPAARPAPRPAAPRPEGR